MISVTQSEMKKHARRLFNVYSGEERKVSLFVLLGLLLSLAVSSAWKLSDALFLIHLGSEVLPVAYASVALLLIGMALVLINAFNRFTPTTIFRTFVFSGVIFFGSMAAGFWLGIDKGHPWFWFFLKVMSQLFFIQSISCFWTALDQYFHFQDAKRLFTLFNCAIYIGTGLAGLLIQSGLLSVHSFFSLIFCLWAAVFVLSSQVSNMLPVDDPSYGQSGPEDATSLKSVAKQIVSSPFTILLMLGNLALYLLMTTTEYNYLSSFEQHFSISGENSSDESGFGLTRFLGTCIASVGLGNLIMGWFLYSRLVGRFGVTTLILVTPLAYLGTYLGWTQDKGLLFAIIGFVIVEGLYPVIEDNNFNLLLNAVPSKVKYKVRVMIESFSEPLGMLLSALLLSLPMVNNFILGLVLSIVSLFFALLLRKGYFQAIFSNLSGTKEWVKRFFKKGRIESEEQVLELVAQSDPKMQLMAFRACVYSDNLPLLKKALRATEHLGGQARIDLLQLLYRSPYRSSEFVLDTLSAWQEEIQENELLEAISSYKARCPFEQSKIKLAVPAAELV
jgi:ATP/ADP translocase